ncbi:g5459 [Coccomyxa elongata]
MASKVASAVVAFGVLATLACMASCDATDHENKFSRDSQPATFYAVDRAFGRNLLALNCNYDSNPTCSDPLLPYCCQTQNNYDGSSCIQLSSEEAASCGTSYPYSACCSNS